MLRSLRSEMLACLPCHISGLFWLHQRRLVLEEGLDVLWLEKKLGMWGTINHHSVMEGVEP